MSQKYDELHSIDHLKLPEWFTDDLHQAGIHTESELLLAPLQIFIYLDSIDQLTREDWARISRLADENRVTEGLEPSPDCDQSLLSLDLTNRVANGLYRSGFRSVTAIKNMRLIELLSIRNFGLHALIEVVTKLRNHENSPKDTPAINPSFSDWLHLIKERHMRIITMRYGLVDGQVKSYRETSECFGVTPGRIRQIETCALRNFRSNLHKAPMPKIQEIITGAIDESGGQAPDDQILEAIQKALPHDETLNAHHLNLIFDIYGPKFFHRKLGVWRNI